MSGPVTGTAAFAASYTVLPAAGIYKPITEYDPETLWQDLSAHLVYGTATAVAFRLLAGRFRQPR